jgi:hypothetical protein
LGAAREKIRVAHALEGLPKIAASMARGELSYSKVRALTRIACGTTEDSLLMIALHGTAHHVEKLVRHYRQVEHAEDLARETRQEERCRLSCWYDSDGSLIVQGRIPALKGALFEKALEAAMEALRRALNARDTGCRFPGCTFDRYIDAHHVEHWADGGETKLSNLVTLCRAHHRMVHKGEIVIKARENGEWQFFSQDGRPYKEAYRENRPSYEWNAIHDVQEAQGVYIDARTATTRWAGERMDYDLAIFGLFSSVARARRVAAETSEH